MALDMRCLPQEVVQAAELVGRWFDELNITAWVLGPCASRAEFERLQSRLESALNDTERMDWLADPDNTIGNVQLPKAAVTANLHSLRDAIDAARAMAACSVETRSNESVG